MQKHCPHCGEEILSDVSNFCASCGRQLRELSSEDAALVPPEDLRQKPMPVIKKVSPIRVDFFVFQFGPICKGGRYLCKMITQFLVTGESIKDANFDELLKKVCAEECVELFSAKRAIQRFINRGWAEGYQYQWRKYAGWIEQQPPSTGTAMRLLLQLYVTQQKNMEKGYGKNGT